MNAITVFLGNMLMRYNNGGIFGFLGAGMEEAVTENYNGVETGSSHDAFWKNMVIKLARIADWLLPTIMILLGMVGAIYALVLGIRFSKAESDDKKNEAKKKLINALIGIIVAILVMLVMFLVLNNASFIKKWIMDAGTTEK